MKIFINRQPVTGPWGGGNNFVRAFYDFAPTLGVTVGNKLNQRYDAILMIDPRPDELGVGMDEIARYRAFQPRCKVFQRVNECDARKGEQNIIDPVLRAASALNDHTFFVSEWMQKYHLVRNWQCGAFNVIYNGVDKNIFSPRPKLNNGKVNILTHHWSDNPYKGEDVHVWLDKFVSENPDFTYTYIGRTKAKLPNSKIIDPLWGQDLGNELGKYDIYVSGTVLDPGPNHILEALAAKIPTYTHARGGGAVEFVGDDHTYKTVEDLESILRAKEWKANPWQPDDWKTCIGNYIEKITEVVNG